MTMSTPAPFPQPDGLILVKGPGWEVYGIWPSGYTRQITAAEYKLWGSPAIDHQIPKDAPDAAAQVAQLAAYDRALRA
jgi:hypothetical protein